MASRRLQALARVSLVTLLCACAGCSKKPEQLLQDALAAEKLCKESYEKQDAKKAQRASDRANKAAEQLKKLLAEKPNESLQHLLAQAEAAARSAREVAGTAAEEQQRRDMLAAWKIKAYRKSRDTLLGGLLPAMASAAQSAGKLGTNASSVETALAGQGWALANLVGAADPLADGTPDWSGAANQLSDWSTNQSIEFRAFLGLAFSLLGSTDFAVAEFESMNRPDPSDTTALAIYHGGRTYLYTLQGWNHLAAAEMEKFNGFYSISNGPAHGRMIVALLHAGMAYEAGKRGQFARLDQEIAESIRAWPNNPALTFLTGERLAATGEWEKAAASLEASAAGTEDAWIASRLAQRARELRDGKGSAKAFVLDSRFLVPFAARSLASQMEQSAAAKKLEEVMAEAKAFGSNLLQRLSLQGIAGQSTATQTNSP